MAKRGMILEEISREGDATGNILWDYFQGEKGFYVVERDDGYINVIDPEETFFSRYEDWPEYVKKALELVKGKVLDVGCGAGRHSLYLQEKGFDVLGIDASPLAIKVCKERGLKKVKIMSIAEIRKLKLNSFDTILMMWNGFGLFGSFERARSLLGKFYKITSDDGLIIADTMNPYETDNPAHLKYHKRNKKKGRMGGQIKMRIRYKKFATDWYDYLFVSKEEMKNILKGTGWKVKEFIDSEDSPSYIAILKKTRG